MDIVLQIFFDGLDGVFAEDSALEIVLRPLVEKKAFFERFLFNYLVGNEICISRTTQ
jgi:hypothetical protein